MCIARESDFSGAPIVKKEGHDTWRVLWTFSSFKPALLCRDGILMLYIYAGTQFPHRKILISPSVLLFTIIANVKYGDDFFSWQGELESVWFLSSSSSNAIFGGTKF